MTCARTVADLRRWRALDRRLLVVLAHPDDEAYGCAGAMARAGADEHAAAVLLCMTRGEASSLGARQGLAPEDVGDLREARLLEVAGHCGLGGLILPGLPDGRLDRLPVPQVAAPIAAALDAFRPQVVITADPRGINGHRDHIAVHWAVRRALEDYPEVRLAMVAYPEEVSEAARPRLLFSTPDREIDATLTLTPSETATKEACLRTHEALVTLYPESASEGLSVRPPVEHYDFFGEAHDPRLSDLFAGLATEEDAAR